jgi:WD40 repeat protein
LFLGLLVSASAAQPPTKKLPVPQDKDLQRATALVNELYRDEIAKAEKDSAAGLKLAQALLLEARSTNDDPAGKYVLLNQSSNLAGKAGDASTALEALEELGLSFEVPAATLRQRKTQALTAASQANAAPEVYQGVVDAAQALLDDAVTDDDFDSALALAQAAENAAKKLKSVALVSSIRKRLDAVKASQAEYAQVKPFVDALKKDPKDAKANLEAGKYYALGRGHWEKGLPLLQHGADRELAALAAADLANPQGWQQMSQLGGQWSKEAAKLKGQANVNTLLRAYQWYQRTLGVGSISEKERAQVEAAMLAINEQLPADQRAGEIAVELRRASGHDGPVFGVALSGDGSKLATAGADATVRLWDAKSMKQLRRFDGHIGDVWTVRLSPDGRHIVSGGFDKSIRLWDPVSGRESKRLAGHDDYVRALCLSADGQFLLSGGDDRLVKLWDLGSGSELKSMPGHDHFVFGVAISRDGKRGLTASLDRTVRLWDLSAGNTIRELTGHSDTVLSVAFTPDGQRAISASTDKTLRLWDLNTGQTIHTLTGHTGYAVSVAVSPDGRRALSAGYDGKVILWDLDHGKLLRVLQGHTGPVWSVAFSGDGRLAATGGNDGTVRVWGSAK